MLLAHGHDIACRSLGPQPSRLGWADNQQQTLASVKVRLSLPTKVQGQPQLSLTHHICCTFVCPVVFVGHWKGEYLQQPHIDYSPGPALHMPVLCAVDSCTQRLYTLQTCSRCCSCSSTCTHSRMHNTYQQTGDRSAAAHTKQPTGCPKRHKHTRLPALCG